MSATAALPETLNSSNLSAGVQAGSAGALIMGADYRGLGVVRSLGRRGIPVWVIKQGGHLVATTSRYVCRNISWPPKDEQRQIDFLLDLADKHYLCGWVLFPTDDYAVTLVSRNYEALASHYRLTVPPWEELRWACDKRLLHRLAHNLGVHQPWAAAPNSREELAALDHAFPLILKPALRMEPGSLAVPKAWRIDDRASLLARYDQACTLIAPENLIVQELVPGGGESQFSYAALCKDGVPLASIVARRTRQYPMDFGQFSTYVETVDEPQVIEPSVRLLKALRFTGLVEVEFKKDPRDGQCKVIDINPRVWGWHTLSRSCGVDFPHLLWLLLRGESFSQLHGRAGQRWMHMSGDISVAIREILSGRLSVRDYARSLRRPLESAIFAWDDPLPGLLDLPLFAGTLGKRALQRKKA